MDAADLQTGQTMLRGPTRRHSMVRHSPRKDFSSVSQPDCRTVQRISTNDAITHARTPTASTKLLPAQRCTSRCTACTVAGAMHTHAAQPDTEAKPMITLYLSQLEHKETQYFQRCTRADSFAADHTAVACRRARRLSCRAIARSCAACCSAKLSAVNELRSAQGTQS